MMIKNRKGEIISQNESQDRWLKFLYRSMAGRICLKVLTRPVVSRIVGCYMNSIFSTGMITSFVRNNGIDLSEYEKKRYTSYNDFFTRKIKTGKRLFNPDSRAFISPCDSKLSVFKIDDRSMFSIKNSYYRIKDLIPGSSYVNEFQGGYCMIFRLTVDDYHRYCYIDEGSKGRNVFVPGELHTVNPIALEHCNIYKRNSREYTILHTENFGDVAQIEVGAMMVGKIKNHHHEHTFHRGEEKGYFEFGGSTVVLLVKEHQVTMDEDILINSKNNVETVVKIGEKIGMKI